MLGTRTTGDNRDRIALAKVSIVFPISRCEFWREQARRGARAAVPCCTLAGDRLEGADESCQGLSRGSAVPSLVAHVLGEQVNRLGHGRSWRTRGVDRQLSPVDLVVDASVLLAAHYGRMHRYLGLAGPIVKALRGVATPRSSDGTRPRSRTRWPTPNCSPAEPDRNWVALAGH